MEILAIVVIVAFVTFVVMPLLVSVQRETYLQSVIKGVFVIVLIAAMVSITSVVCWAVWYLFK